MSEPITEYPKVCECCGEKIGTRTDLDFHGLGNCAPICEICSGSGIDDKHLLAKHDVTLLTQVAKSFAEPIRSRILSLIPLRESTK